MMMTFVVDRKLGKQATSNPPRIEGGGGGRTIYPMEMEKYHSQPGRRVEQGTMWPLLHLDVT